MFIKRIGNDIGRSSNKDFFGWDENGSIKVAKETLPTKERN